MASPVGLLALGGAAALIYLGVKSKESGAPVALETTTVTGPSGKQWEVQLMNNEGGEFIQDVWAPAGAWGPHQKMRVLRYKQVGQDKSTRTYVTSPPSIPKAIMDTAILDFGVKIPPGVTISVSGSRARVAGNCRHVRWPV